MKQVVVESGAWGGWFIGERGTGKMYMERVKVLEKILEEQGIEVVYKTTHWVGGKGSVVTSSSISDKVVETAI